MRQSRNTKTIIGYCKSRGGRPTVCGHLFAASATKWDKKLWFSTTKITMVKGLRLLIKRKKPLWSLVSLAVNQVKVDWLVVVRQSHDLWQGTLQDLRATNVTKVRIGNGDYISISGNAILIISCADTTYFWCSFFSWNWPKFIRCWSTYWTRILKLLLKINIDWLKMQPIKISSRWK